MNRVYLLILIFHLFVSCSRKHKIIKTEDSKKTGIRSYKFKGTIFDSAYQDIAMYIITPRFTPSTEEIFLAEKILRLEIGNANRPRINQLGKREYIDRNLNKYFRQYVGFINEKGHRCIHINFHWDRFSLLDRLKGDWDDRLEYNSDYSRVLDGGSHYWKINVDLVDKRLFGMEVNGIAWNSYIIRLVASFYC